MLKQIGRFAIEKVGLIKVGKGAVIANSGSALAVTALSMAPDLVENILTHKWVYPFYLANFSVALNLVRKLLTKYEITEEV